MLVYSTLKRDTVFVVGNEYITLKGKESNKIDSFFATTEIDDGDWSRLSETYKDSLFFKNNSIYVSKDKNDATAKAKDVFERATELENNSNPRPKVKM